VQIFSLKNIKHMTDLKELIHGMLAGA
jgi:hypothetical protein